MPAGPELLQKARDWIEGDPDEETREELSELLARGDEHELSERFARPLTFGTAGLRGVVGAGPARMNRAVVIRTTRALAEDLLATEPEARTLPVVVGYDARHQSRAFAEDVAGVLSAAKIPVRHFEEPVPTPLVAYAVRALAASAGVVITASHNPAEYDGYKLYAKDGVQIIPPVDERIQRRMAALGPAVSVPRAEGALGGRAANATPVPKALLDRYLDDIAVLRPPGPGDRALKIVYTPLHGVGGPWATRALARAGFTDVVTVPEQEAPDGDFPTVSFPNPEETSALALAARLAESSRADLVLANDPDADRLAVMVPTAAGRWVPLTGNQIGVLLADFLLEHVRAPTRALVTSSIVSTPMIDAVCKAHGARSERTLTGFKWIWTAARALSETAGVTPVFGFEEAIGFSVGAVVRDKDGISAALVFAELAARCRAEGISVLERLERLRERCGFWVSVQRSVVRTGEDGAREIERAVERLVLAPPDDLDGHSVTRVTDYRANSESRPSWLGKAPLVELGLGDAGRVLVRPSGTEPKLKVYADLRGPGAAGSTGGATAAGNDSEQAAGRVAESLLRFIGFL